MRKYSKKPNIIELAIKYHEVTLAVFTLLVIFGLYSLFTMQRSEDPNIDIKNAVVYALYPGADIIETEEQVTNKIEEMLFSYEEIDKEDTHSVTQDGRTTITIALHDHVDVQKLDVVWSKIRSGIQNLRPSLPSGVIGPILNSDFGETTAIIVSLSSSRHSYAEKKEFLKTLEDQIKVLPKSSKINRLGLQQEQITITTSSQKMARYGLSLQQVADAISEQNNIVRSGTLTSNEFNVPIKTNSLYTSEEQIENQIIVYKPNGENIRLKDIANVERGYADLQSKILMDEEDVLALSVEMQPGNNIVSFGEELNVALDKARDLLPGDVKINMIHSQPEIVESAVSHFFFEFFIAVVAVIAVIMILLPFRTATVSAIASPVSILVTFGILNFLDFGIHSVTLAGMIICLGMVVDDAVIIVDNYIEKLDEGMDRWTAAWKSATQLFIPVMTATATIILAFMPLAFTMTGITKDFIFAMPITVSIALVTSFLVAIFLTPYLCYLFIKKGVHNKEDGQEKKKTILDKVQEKYDRSVEWVFVNTRISMLTGVASVLVGMFLFSFVSQEFFPKLERDIFNVEVWLPEGATVEKTEETVKRIEAYIENDERIERISAFIGQSSPRFHSNYAPEPPTENYAQLFIKTVGADEAQELIDMFVTDLAYQFPETNLRIRQLSYQETSTPLEIRVVGENIDSIQEVAIQVEDILKNIEGANWTHSDWREEYYRLAINIDDQEANQLGFSSEGISQYIGGLLDGIPITTYWEGEEAVNVSLRLDEENRKDFNDISDLYISNKSGNSIPLRQVATFEPEWMPGRIAHRNGLRTITIVSEAQWGRFPSDILVDAEPKIENIELPSGISINYGGDKKSTLDNMPNLITALSISILLIFLTLMFQFKSIKKTLIILSTFLLSIPGAAIGLLALGHPFGFTAFLGTISLIGIVVRNGIILVDYADELVRDKGYDIRKASLLAAQRRMRPIFLTASAAAIGVVPMIISGSPLWAPLASVLCIGLMWSMFMTLYIIPLMYYKWLEPKKDSKLKLQEID